MPSIRLRNPQGQDYWVPISEQQIAADGYLSFFKVFAEGAEHHLLLHRDDMSPTDWAQMVFKAAGGAGLGLPFGPLGMLVGGFAGLLSFFKSKGDPGYYDVKTQEHWIGRMIYTRNSNDYRP